MAFDRKELEFTKRGPNFVDMTKPGPPIYQFPITAKEEAARMYRQKGSMWMPYGVEIGVFTPQIIPDNIARGFVFEKNMMSPDKYGGKDMFGVEWEYVPVVGGSMEKPGVPHLLNDISEWRDKIVWPDINSWDWGDKIVISVCDDPLPAGATPEEQKAQAVRFVKEYYSPDRPSQFSLYSNANLTDAYVEGLYETSREMYESGTK